MSTLTTLDQRKRKDPVLVEELQGISFQIFQKKSDTRESHGEGENALLLIIFISIEILATHLYVPKYIVVICTTACAL